jgi:tetratricopeptide (TPR) repeat protein
MDSLEFKEKLNTAFKHHQQDKLSEAETIYNELLQEDPDNANILNLLGLVFYRQKKYDRAVEYIKRALAIAPDAYFYLNLGNIYYDMGEIDNAISEYNKSLELEKNNIKVLFSLAECYKRKNNFESAIIQYNNALNLRPNDIEICMNIVVLYLDIKKKEEALEILETIIKNNPEEVEVLLNLGLYYVEEDMPDKALEVYNRILQMKPGSYKAYLNLACLYYETYEHDKSIECCNKALDLKPEYPDAYLNLGNAYKAMKDIPRAMGFYEKALHLRPNYVEAHFNLSTTCLLTEVYETGWKHYEWRFLKKEIHYPILPKFPQPMWDGSPIAGKTIYVSYEQGYGDVIQFSRFLPVLASMGAKVIFKCPSALERILRQSELNAEIFNINYPDNLLEFDTYIYLMSLPYIFGVNSSNIPYPEGYLKADKVQVEHYRQQYFDSDCYKVGICWNSSVRGAKKRWIPLEYFYKLAEIDNVKLYSIQSGLGVEKLNDLPDGIEIVDLGKTFNDFADTAAAIENLDLVISTDTAVVHLAAALGVPAWNLVTFMSCWRWMQDREDTPWYKSMRIFRQRRHKDWKEVLERVHSTLKTSLKG